MRCGCEDGCVGVGMQMRVRVGVRMGDSGSGGGCDSECEGGCEGRSIVGLGSGACNEEGYVQYAPRHM